MPAIDLNSIHIDETLSSRDAVNWAVVDSYVAALDTDAQFPPVIVGWRALTKTYILIDGRHRYEAFRKSQKYKISFFVTKRPEDEWFEEALGRNTQHGLTLTSDERLRAAKRLSDMGYDFSKISKLTALPQARIENYLSSPPLPVMPVGDVQPITTTREPFKSRYREAPPSRPRGWENLDGDQRAPSPDTLDAALTSLLHAIERDVVPVRLHDLMRRLGTAMVIWTARRNSR